MLRVLQQQLALGLIADQLVEPHGIGMTDTLQVAGGRRPQPAERTIARELPRARVRIVRGEEWQLRGPILTLGQARLERPGSLLAWSGRCFQRSEAVPGWPARGGSKRLH